MVLVPDRLSPNSSVAMEPVRWKAEKKGDETPAHGIEKLICFSLDRSSNGLIGDQRRNGRDRAIRISPSNCFDTRVPIFPPPLFSSSLFFSRC